MAFLVPNTLNRVLDANGSPVSGGKAYFYASGTTTLKTVYADADATTPLANPVVADGGGLLANIYLGVGAYRAVYKTADDVTISDQDPFTPGSSDASGIDYSSGDESRTVASKLSEIVSVADPPYKAVGDGSTNDYAAIQAALSDMEDAGGGLVMLQRGKTYRVEITTATTDKGLVVGDNVEFFLNGAVLEFACTGDVYCVRPRGSRWKIRGGTIRMVSGSGSGSQSGWQAPICVGPAYGEAGTVGDVSVFEGASNWEISDLELANVRTAGVCIQITGGVRDWVIRRISVPDSTTLGGAIHADWGIVAPPQFTSSNVQLCRDLFDAGTAYTTHPQRGLIEDISVGNLSYSVSHGIRFSGCNDIQVRRVSVDGCTMAGFFNTAGDLGHELSLSADRQARHKGIRIEGLTVADAGNGNGAFVECLADEIYRAQQGATFTGSVDLDTLTVSAKSAGFIVPGQVISGTNITAGTRIVAQLTGTTYGVGTYSLTNSMAAASTAITGAGYDALVESTGRAGMVLSDVKVYSDGGASVSNGIEVKNIVDVTLNDCVARGFSRGIRIAEGADQVTVNGGDTSDNRFQGLFAGAADSTTPNIKSVAILRHKSYRNNQTATADVGQIVIARADRVEVRACELGAAGETAKHGLVVTDTVTGLIWFDNYTAEIDGAGAAYVIGTTNSYRVESASGNNDQAAGITHRSGCDITFTKTEDGLRRGQALLASVPSLTPTAGTDWAVGETIEVRNAAAGAASKIKCSTASAADQGTWKVVETMAA